MKLLMVRHGETGWNLEGRYQGRLESELSPRGAAQARALAKRLQRESIKAIVSSPLVRAKDTAQACADELKLPVAIDGRLTEIGHGAWEGKRIREVERRWPEMLRAWREAPQSVRFPGGESLADVAERVGSFFDEAKRSQAAASRSTRFGNVTLCVTHDAVIRIAVLAIRAEPLSAFQRFRIENAALTEFDVSEDRVSLVALNENEYLGSLRGDAATQAL
ncbi:MAG: phosphoglycerate mutase [Candidatus Eremiobacter antarcticus]|nr:histidine phosphatase family protein [Candidatus Eremiobacteraeota bacterium]MBC5807837.1 histidine phosphatase family protein [Candidatus Eremiobacteraeota bacterium]PZR62788.1 MAG: phosphoglycerate mutase [Candidatus Eremiobacter sp. RRmetagenome_bin22]